MQQTLCFFPKQCLHDGVLTFRVKELVADRNGARGGGTGPWFRCSRCGFARILAFRCCRCGFAQIPLHFDAPAVVLREFRPLVASSGLFWGGYLGCRPQRRARWDGALVSALVSREFRCVSMLPLWFCANSGLSWPLQASADRNGPRGETTWGQNQ